MGASTVSIYSSRKKRQVIDPFDWRIESEVPRFLFLYILKTDIDLIPILSYGLFTVYCVQANTSSFYWITQY